VRRRVPERTCVGCARQRPAAELVRVVAAEDGELKVGRTLPGRGAWFCRESAAECARLAGRKSRLARALRRPLAEGALDRLCAELAAISR